MAGFASPGGYGGPGGGRTRDAMVLLGFVFLIVLAGLALGH